jgi:uncharacterized protein
VEALEKKVGDYRRATGNDIAVAVVPSLNGMTVEEYAQGLFRAWGVGKYGVNNGVLFLWAPKERLFRVHVGSGLDGVLTKAETDRIVARVRVLFRANQFVEGVNAGVDGIIAVLGGGVPEQSQEDSGRPVLTALGVAALLGVMLTLLIRRRGWRGGGRSCRGILRRRTRRWWMETRSGWRRSRRWPSCAARRRRKFVKASMTG